jgi:hypothetical protein
MAQQTASGTQTASSPIVIDLGKVKKKKVRQLKEGRGDLAREVENVLADARRNHTDGNKELVPVILVYQKKRRKGGGGGGGLFPF